MERTVREIDGLWFVLAEAPKPADREYIKQRIKVFNDVHSEHHRAVRKTGTTPLDISIRDDQGKLLGGLAASTYWGWLEIEKLWIEERLRGRGYGRELLALVESEAQARGCSRALVRTFSFQAKGFYQRLGYWDVGRLDDYPPGQSFFWMQKDFSPLHGGKESPDWKPSYTDTQLV